MSEKKKPYQMEILENECLRLIKLLRSCGKRKETFVDLQKRIQDPTNGVSQAIAAVLKRCQPSNSKETLPSVRVPFEPEPEPPTSRGGVNVRVK